MSGSTDRAGFLYHEPAFPVSGYEFHRGDNSHRLRMILQHCNFWNKKVLDLGCNVGYFSHKLALQGAIVTGVDTDMMAIGLARDLANRYLVENVAFDIRTAKHAYVKGKDVLLALSVLPWIYESEPNPEAYVRKLFNQIAVAFIEIQYPPDGRASVPGVTDDETCRAYLETYFKHVLRIGETHDNTNGVIRNRTMWKCWNDIDPQPIYGSQCFIEMDEHTVTKKKRPDQIWLPAEEAKFLSMLEPYNIAPRVLECTKDKLVMTRIHGKPISATDYDPFNMQAHFDRIASILERVGISHNDVRPSNLISGVDGSTYIIDFGWASYAKQPRPEGVNRLFSGTDREAFAKILDAYPMWRL